MPSVTATLLESPDTRLVQQGAEAKIYKGVLHPVAWGSTASCVMSEPVLLKYRFTKKYRHPSLNASLTKSRVAGEARALMRCLRSGIRVPGIRMVDASEGVIGIEWIEGQSVRALLGADDESGVQFEPDKKESEIVNEQNSVDDRLAVYGVDQSGLMCTIGTEIAKMHKVDVIHGDLTTSNMMLRSPSRQSSADESKNIADIVLIDFGLSFISSLAEDKAVDLYVLERAFASTHPHSESLFILVLKAYEAESGKNWVPVNRKLDEVRLRGRKRSMVG